MSHPASRKPLPFTLAALAAVAVVSIAARAPQGPVPQGTAPQGVGAGTPPATPAAAAPAAPASSELAPAAADSAATDSTAADSLAIPVPVVAPTPAAAAAPAAWPVDPVTGQTLVNGIPVVGRAFVMHKTDHLRKMGTVADVLAREAETPVAPHADATYTPVAPEHARRFRGVMVQSTLWDMDHKRSAVERRYYRPSTQAP